MGDLRCVHPRLFLGLEAEAASTKKLVTFTELRGVEAICKSPKMVGGLVDPRSRVADSSTPNSHESPPQPSFMLMGFQIRRGEVLGA